MSHRPFIIGNSTWLTTIAFMQLFNDLEVRNFVYRYDEEYTKALKVDVTLDMKERIYHKLLHGGHKELEQADTRLPRLSIQIDAISPRQEDYTGKDNKRLLKRGADNSIESDIQPYPVRIDYTVGIWCKKFEHYAQIIENIIPWFDPYVTVGVKERNLNIKRDLKVQLTGVNNNSNFVMQGSDQRIIRGEMNFSVDSWMYKVKKTQTDDIIFKSSILLVDIITPMSSEIITISAGHNDI
jgi:hypothetical protein